MLQEQWADAGRWTLGMVRCLATCRRGGGRCHTPKVIDISIDASREVRSVRYQMEQAVKAMWETGLIPGRGGGPFNLGGM